MKEIETIDELNAYVLKQIQRVGDGEFSPASLNAIANACGKIVSGINTQLQYSKITGTTPYVGLIKPENKNIKKIEEEIKPIEIKVEQQNEIQSEEQRK